MFKTVKQEVQVVDAEGLTALLGTTVLLMCATYFYYGKLEGVNETVVLLSEAKLVYETGVWTASKWKDAQPLPNQEAHYVAIPAIESFCAVTKD